MRLHDQCITFDQAKRLYELGVKQNSLFSWWVEKTPNKPPVLSNNARYYCPSCCSEVYSLGGEYAAFTVAELGQMLNSETFTHREGTELSQYANWSWCYEGIRQAFGPYATEAEARAEMLIHCLEYNYSTVEDVNKRLND